MKLRRQLHVPIVVFVVLAAVSCALPARAGGHVDLHGVRMAPHGRDAERYSRLGFGVGIEAVAPLPWKDDLLAGVAGLEIVNLMGESTSFQDEFTGFTGEQETSQDYGRFYLGARVGPQDEVLRPYAGASLSLNSYGISTSVTVPDQVSQGQRSERHLAFGCDGTLGVDLDIFERFVLGGGVRYVRTFNLPQQLGAGSVPVSPGYFQVFVGLGVSFEFIGDALPRD
jgi:hypothetical protein